VWEKKRRVFKCRKYSGGKERRGEERRTHVRESENCLRKAKEGEKQKVERRRT
jgi:hypothetical protein